VIGGILSNAISPVAATRVYTRPAEPGVVLAAAGGRFEVRHWARSTGVVFGREPVEPERIAERWAELAAPAGWSTRACCQASPMR
jgi:hypothetical protein